MLSIDFLMPSFVTATSCIFLPTRKRTWKPNQPTKKKVEVSILFQFFPLPKTSVPKFRFWDFNFALPQRCRSIGCLLFLQHIFLWIAGEQARSHRMLTSRVSEEMCVVCRCAKGDNQRQLSFLASPFGAIFALKGRSVVNRDHSYDGKAWGASKSLDSSFHCAWWA